MQPSSDISGGGMTSIFSNFGQVFDGITLYYRVETKGMTRFISSKKEQLTIKQMEKRGVRFPTLIQNHEDRPYSCLKNNPWSSQSINDFLKSNQRIADPKDLFLKLKNTILKFPHPEEEKELLLLTLVLFQTGLYTVFKTIPYFSLVGNPYLIQMLLELIENISFNAIRLNSPNGSLMSRIISLYGSTLIITIHDDHPGNYSFNNILSLLEEGCRTSGSFYVLNEYGLPISLPIYSPKMLDVGIRSKYLTSLPIEIQVKKQPDSPFPLRTREIDQELQELRDDLHIFCLENVSAISDIDQGLEAIPGIPNQYMEFLSGTFSIAKHLDTFFEVPFLFASLATWARDVTSRLKHNQEFDDKNMHILHLVAEFIQRFEPNIDGYYVAEDIARYVNEAGDLSKKLRPEDITRRLKHFDPHRKRDWVDVDRGEDKKQRTKIKINEKKIIEYLDG
jgi:hypothetical protein